MSRLLADDKVSIFPALAHSLLILQVYTGGIGLALLVMLIAMLQDITAAPFSHDRKNHRNGQASVEQNLGILLVNFFDIYGRKLNTSDVGVSCNGEGTSS
ncbi:hypothetical protein HAX54_042874 [Datura stramonium]|uniref:PAP-associated domain-containing protein n=1 Tax=Datura stramonium TaxID=4076 RepID=A0ABS8W1K6_DATST|nr:hypothetical protein [Datura stramonium]